MDDVERAFREAHGPAIATLIRTFGDITLAEDAVQDAFATAIRRWPRDGVPDNPAGWIVTTARNRAIDAVRRDRRRRELTEQIAADRLRAETTAAAEDPEPMHYDQLRLIFTCCHPAIRVEDQVALTLRLIGGLTPAEVASAFLVSEDTMAKRLVRAKYKIKAGHVPYRVPNEDELPERLRAVLTVLYLIYNAGADDVGRRDVRAEAIRLTRMLVALMPDEPEAVGLLALLILSEARMPARGDGAHVVLLKDQNRSLWDPALISDGQALVLACMRRRQLGPFQLQAAIQALHCAARRYEDTNWAAIVRFYDRLITVMPTPVVALNRAIAVAETQGPGTGLALIEGVAEELDGYHLLHAARGSMLDRLERPREAADAYHRAATLARTETDISFLNRRSADLTGDIPSGPTGEGVKLSTEVASMPCGAMPSASVDQGNPVLRLPRREAFDSGGSASAKFGGTIEDMDAHEQFVAGSSALAAGEWAAARDCFEAALSVEESADALDGLARAVWWLNDPGTALELRARAFARLRHDGRDTEATAVAIWLARQYRGLYRRGEMANGWLSRARSLLGSLPEEGSLRGWLVLAESEMGLPHPRAADAADEALRIARERGDRDLEIVALTRRGACTVSGGGIAEGLSDLHEAMTAATSGEGYDVQYVGEALCTLMEVAGLIGDPGMVEPWATFLVSFRSSYAFGPLLPFETHSATDLISAFCTGCCGGVYLVTGRLDAAEEQLVRAVSQLSRTGLRPRCLHPVADLVALRVLQGRLEEAETLITGFEGDSECAPSAAAVDMALGRPARAVDRLVVALDALAETPVLTLPARAQLVDAALAAGDAELAQDAASRIADLAAATDTALHRAHRDHAAGKVALASGDGEATALLRSAALGFAQSGAPLAACRARMDLARSLVGKDRGLAITEARSALQAFDRMGATAEADRAAAFLRGLGVKGRTGPRDGGLLSQREQEVLGLVCEGLSNAEIAERLFISTRTAGHHVGNILTKLGVRSRTEAAAYALLNLPAAQTLAHQ